MAKLTAAQVAELRAKAGQQTDDLMKWAEHYERGTFGSHFRRRGIELIRAILSSYGLIADLLAEQAAEIERKDVELGTAEAALDLSAQTIEQQAARIRELEEDAARLDSGMIRTSERDEFGDTYHCIRKGLDLRAAIDDARAKEAKG